MDLKLVCVTTAEPQAPNFKNPKIKALEGRAAASEGGRSHLPGGGVHFRALKALGFKEKE